MCFLTKSFWVITIDTSFVLLTPPHYFFGLVETYIGFLPCPQIVFHPFRFILTCSLSTSAIRFCFFVIRAALEAGTHLAYPLFLPLVPHGGCPPPFFFLPIFTHLSLNHFLKFSFAKSPQFTQMLSLSYQLVPYHCSIDSSFFTQFLYLLPNIIFVLRVGCVIYPF